MNPPAQNLPGWPALMDTRMAARYLALGDASFRAVAARAGLRPVDLGLAVTRWRRHDLDGLVGRLQAKGGAAVEGGPPEVDRFDAALDYARRRAKRH